MYLLNSLWHTYSRFGTPNPKVDRKFPYQKRWKKPAMLIWFSSPLAPHRRHRRSKFGCRILAHLRFRAAGKIWLALLSHQNGKNRVSVLDYASRCKTDQGWPRAMVSLVAVERCEKKVADLVSCLRLDMSATGSQEQSRRSGFMMVLHVITTSSGWCLGHSPKKGASHCEDHSK